jgi:hypothetical protein
VRVTPEHLRILKTLPKVIEALKALRAESDAVFGLLGPGYQPKPDGLRLEQHQRDHGAALLEDSRRGAPPVLATLRAVPDPEAEATRKAAEAELARRQAERTPEQVEADKFLESQEGTRRALLASMLPGGAP